MSQGGNAATVRAAFEAFRDRDLPRFLAMLDPEIVVHGNKGTFRGVDEVRRWATPTDEGHLYMTVEVDEVHEIGDYVAAGCRRQWRWREGDEIAEETEFGLLVEFRDGRILHWRLTYPSLVDAIAAIPARR